MVLNKKAFGFSDIFGNNQNSVGLIKNFLIPLWNRIDKHQKYFTNAAYFLFACKMHGKNYFVLEAQWSTYTVQNCVSCDRLGKVSLDTFPVATLVKISLLLSHPKNLVEDVQSLFVQRYRDNFDFYVIKSFIDCKLNIFLIIDD